MAERPRGLASSRPQARLRSRSQRRRAELGPRTPSADNATTSAEAARGSPHARQGQLLAEVDYPLARMLAKQHGCCSMPNARTLYMTGSGIIEVPTNAFDHWMRTGSEVWANSDEE